jgi:hypothetical protein
MPYFKDLKRDMEFLQLWMDLAKEQGADMTPVEAEVREFIKKTELKLLALPAGPGFTYQEPDGLCRRCA